MKNSTLVTIWYCSPVSVNDGGEVLQHFVNLRSTKQTFRQTEANWIFSHSGNTWMKLRSCASRSFQKSRRATQSICAALLLLGHLKKKVNRSLTMGRGSTAFCRFSPRLLERTPFGTQPRLLSALKRGEPCLRSK